MRKKELLGLLAALLLGTALFCASTRPVLERGNDYRLVSVAFEGREITSQVDQGALCDLLWTARISRLPGGDPPYDGDSLQIDLWKEPEGGSPMRLVLPGKRGNACRVYQNGRSYVLRDGDALRTAVEALLP